jgi:hypothetical protein
MAYKQMTTLYGDEEPWFNLSNSVGRPGANRKNDVMLVQALFNFVAKRRAGDTSLLGFARHELPYDFSWVRFMQIVDSACAQRRLLDA